MKLVLHLHVRFRDHHYVAQTARPWIGRVPVCKPVLDWGLSPPEPLNVVSISLLRKPPPPAPLEGTIDEVAVFDRSLTPDEVARFHYYQDLDDAPRP